MDLHYITHPGGAMEHLSQMDYFPEIFRKKKKKKNSSSVTPDISLDKGLFLKKNNIHIYLGVEQHHM